MIIKYAKFEFNNCLTLKSLKVGKIGQDCINWFLKSFEGVFNGFAKNPRQSLFVHSPVRRAATPDSPYRRIWRILAICCLCASCARGIEDTCEDCPNTVYECSSINDYELIFDVHKHDGVVGDKIFVLDIDTLKASCRKDTIVIDHNDKRVYMPDSYVNRFAIRLKGFFLVNHLYVIEHHDKIFEVERITGINPPGCGSCCMFSAVINGAEQSSNVNIDAIAPVKSPNPLFMHWKKRMKR